MTARLLKRLDPVLNGSSRSLEWARNVSVVQESRLNKAQNLDNEERHSKFVDFLMTPTPEDSTVKTVSQLGMLAHDPSTASIEPECSGINRTQDSRKRFCDEIWEKPSNKGDKKKSMEDAYSSDAERIVKTAKKQHPRRKISKFTGLNLVTASNDEEGPKALMVVRTTTSNADPAATNSSAVKKEGVIAKKREHNRSRTMENVLQGLSSVLVFDMPAPEPDVFRSNHKGTNANKILNMMTGTNVGRSLSKSADPFFTKNEADTMNVSTDRRRHRRVLSSQA